MSNIVFPHLSSPQQQPVNFAQPSLTAAYSPYSGSSNTLNRSTLLSPTHSTFLHSQHLDTFDLLNRQADMGWPDVSKGLQSVSGPSNESNDPDPNWRINGIYAQ